MTADQTARDAVIAELVARFKPHREYDPAVATLNFGDVADAAVAALADRLGCDHSDGPYRQLLAERDRLRPVLTAACAYADSTAEPTDTPHEGALLDAVAAYRAAEPPWDVSLTCGDSRGPHGVGGPCVLPPEHPHVDGIGGVWPSHAVAAGGEAGGVLHMAMRYALGRSTYAPGEVLHALRAHAAQLPAYTRLMMAAEIDEVLNAGRAGMDCDVAVWRQARDLLRQDGEEIA